MTFYEHSLKNVYIGEYGWKPWANTLAYWKLDGDLNDYSGNNLNFSMGYGSASYWTLASWKKYFILDGNNNTATVTNTTAISNSAITISMYLNTIENYWSNYQNIVFDPFRIMNWKGKISIYDTNNTWPSITLWNWYHVLTIWDNWTEHLYLNWELQNTTFNYTVETSAPTFIIWNNPWNYTASTRRAKWYVSEIIVENKKWTETEITNYYNLTKSNYGY